MLSTLKGVVFLDQVTYCCRSKDFALGASCEVTTTTVKIVTDRLTLSVPMSDKLKQGPPIPLPLLHSPLRRVSQEAVSKWCH